MNSLIFTIFLAVLYIVLLGARWDWWRNSPLNRPNTQVGKILGRITHLSPRNVFRRALLLALASPLVFLLVLLVPVILVAYMLAIVVMMAAATSRGAADRHGDGDAADYAAELLMLICALGLFRGAGILFLQGAMRIVPAPLYFEYLAPRIGIHAIPLLLWHPRFSRPDVAVGSIGFLIVLVSLARDYVRRTWQIHEVESLRVASAGAAATGLSLLTGTAQPAGDCEGPLLGYQSPPFCGMVAGSDNGYKTLHPFSIEGKAGRVLIDPTRFGPGGSLLSRMLQVSGPRRIVLRRHEMADDDEAMIWREFYPGETVYVMGRLRAVRDAKTAANDSRTRVVRAAPDISYRESLRRFFFGVKSLDNVFFISDTGEVRASDCMRRTRLTVLLLGSLWLCLCLVVFVNGMQGKSQWRRHTLTWGGHTLFLKEASLPQSYYHFLKRTYGGKMSDDADPSRWLRKLKDPNTQTKIKALETLGGFPGKSAIIFRDVAPLTADADALVRDAAWRCLRGIHASSPEALAFYRDRLGNEHYPYPLSQVMVGIGPAAVQFVPDLVRIMRDPGEDRLRKRYAVEALGAIGPGAAEALQVLLPLMKASDKRERFAAYRAVVRIVAGSPAGVPYLRGILEGEAWDPMVSGDEDMRREIFEGLGQIGPPASPAVPYLVRVLGSSRGYEERVLLCRTLGRIGPAAREALPVLERAAGGPLEREAKDAIKKITAGGG